MPEIFINYRTGDGEQSATTIARELAHRFGEELVFRASESIKPGQCYPDELLAGVRKSSALLAVIGPQWLESPDSADANSRALDNEEDWVRKEILEALSWGLPVIPVLVGRRMERLSAARLPQPLARLAYIQSLRYDTQQASSDLARIGDVVADLVPGLTDQRAGKGTPDPPQAPGSTSNTLTGDGSGNVQARDVSGGVTGTVIHRSEGPVNTGSGEQNIHQPQVNGDGTTFITGGNQGGVSPRFNTGAPTPEDDR
ncbi:toll/interleukin-1 receptor domain-containing protein [Streptomyces iconiensis]|uniref:Toll/interleukin-1 receptor domain-containing protein n=1 Tax=Streptomyces iconiensis TaxID=1384038 RepID=A0ABT6ZU48_9ACTN|nr:toll/interleukin-1 receptor domain-containing protein [Streptomyces iconiensis]MDJ1132387.1 toll/interleukin-1 receptor domain-containing protein [Streptomyces iconiensis]